MPGLNRRKKTGRNAGVAKLEEEKKKCKRGKKEGKKRKKF